MVEVAPASHLGQRRLDFCGLNAIPVHAPCPGEEGANGGRTSDGVLKLVRTLATDVRESMPQRYGGTPDEDRFRPVNSGRDPDTDGPVRHKYLRPVVRQQGQEIGRDVRSD